MSFIIIINDVGILLCCTRWFYWFLTIMLFIPCDELCTFKYRYWLYSINFIWLSWNEITIWFTYNGFPWYFWKRRKYRQHKVCILLLLGGVGQESRIFAFSIMSNILHSNYCKIQLNNIGTLIPIYEGCLV